MAETFEGWAVLELMGHRRLGGYVTEQEIAGAAFLRIDVPKHPWRDGCTCGSDEPDSTDHEKHMHQCAMFRAPGDDAPVDIFASQFYAPSAVYCITPTTEPVARGLAQHAQPQPVQRWELAPVPQYVPTGATHGAGDESVADDDGDDEPF